MSSFSNLIQVEKLRQPSTVREMAHKILRQCENGRGHFFVHREKLDEVADLVISVIREKYPDMNIPFHSRWGHFRAGGRDRVSEFYSLLLKKSEVEKLKSKLDLVIVSVLLDAGAGSNWKFIEDGRGFSRSEGLAVASYHMFLNGAFSGDKNDLLRADTKKMKDLGVKDLEMGFQVSIENPLVGAAGRLELLKSLAQCFSDRPGDIYETLKTRISGGVVQAKDILWAVLETMSPIWPGRLVIDGQNMGDVWSYKSETVPFHKLSQWMSYSLIEPLEEFGLKVQGLDELTGLPEYRNGGLFLDSGVLEFRDTKNLNLEHEVGSEVVVEWRALTVALLDLVAEKIRFKLKTDSQRLPLVKILEGGTWWAGRKLAFSLRKDGGSPLQVKSDGTVF